MQTKKFLILMRLLKNNAKISKIEGKISSITGLATTSKLTTVESKIPDFSSLVKKEIIMQKLEKLKRKLLTVIMISTLLFSEFNKLTTKNLANLVRKTDFDTKLINL